MAEAVYLLCAVTSALSAGLLLAGYRASRKRLLFYGSVCFGGLFLNNALLFIDLVMVPSLDMSLLRSGIAVAAMLVLIYGLVEEQR